MHPQRGRKVTTPPVPTPCRSLLRCFGGGGGAAVVLVTAGGQAVGDGVQGGTQRVPGHCVMTAFSEWSASYNHPLIHRLFWGTTFSYEKCGEGWNR